MKFENRNGSLNPYIGRLEYKEFYIYLIEFYVGCDCDYLGCEDYRIKAKSIKVRRKDTEEVVLTKSQTHRLKLDRTKNYTEEEVLKITIQNFDI